MRRVTASLALAASLLAFTACGDTLDDAGVEEQILDELRASGSPVTAVTCPDGVAVDAGATFTCTGSTNDGTWTLEVTQTDDAGALTFRVVGTS
ncbi:MAG TPA: DUF4333 domain-containing protein [Actinomycetota bacterium]|nr:DUF4333 domain-containing protein [Actinomycetota bacterium]